MKHQSTYLIFFILQFFYDLIIVQCGDTNKKHVPIIINTWAFDNANLAGWKILEEDGSALDAIVAAGSRCEMDRCDHTVGSGGSPDENGETTLDSMIMDGTTLNVGSVGALRQIKNVIGVARMVLDHSKHSMLVGSQATEFAIKMGFPAENLSSEFSIDQWNQWKKNSCQPNFWINVRPDPKMNCGPYDPLANIEFNNNNHYKIDQNNHDTAGIVAMDSRGRIASGTTTNGLKYKIPGRIGDSPIPGAGSYADQDCGAAAATGDGDIIMRFLSSYQAVENLRRGMTPEKAAEESLRRILNKYPDAMVGIIVLDTRGNFGAACINVEGGFPFIVRNGVTKQNAHRVKCLE